MPITRQELHSSLDAEIEKIGIWSQRTDDLGVNIKKFEHLVTNNDWTVAIQAAIDSLPLRGGKVYFPNGSYNISGTIFIKRAGQSQSVKLVGESRGATRIWATNTESMFSFETNSTTESMFYATIESMTLRGSSDSGATKSDLAVNVLSCQFFEMKNVDLVQFKKGVHIRGTLQLPSYFPVFDNLEISYCGIGLDLGTYASAYNIRAGRIRHGNPGINLGTQADQGNLIGIDLENNTVGIHFQGAKPNVMGCRFEFNETHVTYGEGFFDGFFVGNTAANPETFPDPNEQGFRAFLFTNGVNINTSNRSMSTGERFTLNNRNYKKVEFRSANSFSSHFTIRNATDDINYLTFRDDGKLNSKLTTLKDIEFEAGNIILRSPSGMRRKIVLNDDGTLGVVAP